MARGFWSDLKVWSRRLGLSRTEDSVQGAWCPGFRAEGSGFLEFGASGLR